MEVHQIIGLLIEVVLLAATAIALVAVLLLFLSRFLYGSDDRDLAVLDAHLVENGQWNFPVEGSPAKMSGAPRSRINKPAEREPGPDEEEEGGPDDVPEMVEFDAPNYADFEAEKVKTLKPKTRL